MIKAFVVHSRRTGLGIIRSLGKKGVEIYTADVYKAEGFYSKYTKKGFEIPSLISVGNKALLNRFIEIAKEIDPENSKPYLFTGSDDYLMFFVKHWEQLSRYYKPSFETDLSKLLPCLEKKGMYKIAERANVPIPYTYYSPVDISNVTSYPVIIKPSLKKTDTVDVIKEAFRIAFAENDKQLKVLIGKLERINVPFVVQQFIPGGDDTLYTAGLFSHKGEVKAIGTGRKLRQYPPSLGECSLGELVEAPKLEKYAIRLLQEAGITGICQVEFKKHADEFYLMEINPRPWSWISLMDYAGYNLPWIAIENIEGLKTPAKYIQKNSTGKWMFPMMDLKYNVMLNKNRGFFGYLKDIVTADKLAFFKWRDIKPAFVHVYFAFYYEYIVPLRKTRAKKAKNN